MNTSFSGSSVIIEVSVLRCLMMNGAVIRLNLASASGSCRSSMGRSKSFAKREAGPRSPGFANCMIDQYSMSLFSMGVPDIAILASD